MEDLLIKLQANYPNLSFRASRKFCWAPDSGAICYRTNDNGNKACWSLLHETAHALLQHTAYDTDLELLLLEVAAWEKAKQLAHETNITIDEEHIQDCLDTYRDWLNRRSTCPTCKTKSTQQTTSLYRCFNCGSKWKVSPARFCRIYRSLQPRPLLPTTAPVG